MKSDLESRMNCGGVSKKRKSLLIKKRKMDCCQIDNREGWDNIGGRVVFLLEMFSFSLSLSVLVVRGNRLQ